MVMKMLMRDEWNVPAAVAVAGGAAAGIVPLSSQVGHEALTEQG